MTSRIKVKATVGGVSDWRTLHGTNPVSVKVAGAWRNCAEVYVKNAGIWKPMFYTSGSTPYATSSTWTVPLGVFSITVNAVGGGGGGFGYHSGARDNTASPGGPGGGVKDYITAVNAGDVCEFVIGDGGPPGFDGRAAVSGSATYFYITPVGGAKTLRFTANVGGNAGWGTPGGPGHGSIAIPGTVSAGTVVVGVAGYNMACNNDCGYSVWNYGPTAVGSYLGTPPLAPPSPLAWYLGVSERGGWLSISY